MGKRTSSRETLRAASEAFVPKTGPATKKAEQQVRETGKLHPLVDPKGYDVIRRSLPRFEKQDNGLFELVVGTPMAKEDRYDTTSSMGDNVDVVIRVLPDSFALCSEVLPGYDLQVATGVFNDIDDPIVLCRSQFEMEAEKIVTQLTYMVPVRRGGDVPEDPHYGLFGAAYLTAAYISRIGLKSYDFTISDAPAREQLDVSHLREIFGKEVFDKVAENGHQISSRDLPSTQEIVQDLLRQSHAFFLQVGDEGETRRFWTQMMGVDRVVTLPRTELLPYVQMAIIGLTEGTLDLSQVKEVLQRHNVSKIDADKIVRSVANIPIGAQASLPNFSKRPKKGDLFRSKTDLWPIDPGEVVSGTSSSSKAGKKTKPDTDDAGWL